MKTVTAALAVLLAGVLGGVLAGCGGSHHRANGAGQPTTSSTTVDTSSTSVGPSSSSSSVPVPPTSVPGPGGGPVPSGFQAQSATFVSVTAGWLLGTAPCGSPPCTSVVRTTDRGQRWVGIPAPRTPLSPDGVAAGVSEMRFSDPVNGWAFGPDLWATHDGGATWHQVRLGISPTQVNTLEASGGTVYAVASHCQASGVCRAAELWHAPVGGDAYVTTTGMTLPARSFANGDLALHGRSGYVLAPAGPVGSPGTSMWATDDGTAWSARPSPCPTSQPLALTSVAPIDGTHAVFLCTGNGAAGSTGKLLYASADNGRTFTALPTPAPRGGDGGTLAAATGATFGLASSSAAAWIYLTNDAAHTWTTPLQLSDGGAGFGDFGFQDGTHGLAVHAPIARLQRAGGTSGVDEPATLFLTADGGQTWAPVRV